MRKAAPNTKLILEEFLLHKRSDQYVESIKQLGLMDIALIIKNKSYFLSINDLMYDTKDYLI